MSKKKDDNPIAHPKHYTWLPNGIECWDVTEHMTYNVGTAIAYLWRYELKNGIEDLEKSVEHIQREIVRIKKKNADQIELFPEETAN